MRRRNALLALFLALILVLAGCTPRRSDPFASLAPDGTRYPAPDPDRGTVCYAQMLEEYRRPDVDALEQAAQDLMETVNGMRSGRALSALRELEMALYDYYSSYTLVSVWYSIDRTDAQAQAEYTFYIDTMQQVQDLSDQLYAVIAEGPHVSTLEKNFYGDGFFQPYSQDTGENSRLSVLLAQEARLVAQYDDLCIGQTIEFEGKERSWDDLIADQRVYGQRWIDACTAYYTKYAPLMGDIYLQLMTVRQEIAQLSGYERYSDYAFAGFGRDYTLEQSRAHIQEVLTWLLPVYQAAEEEGLWSEYSMDQALTEKELRTLLPQVLESLDPSLRDIWSFMDTYGLNDLTSSPNKVSNAYEVYISRYEAPFLVANLYGTLEDMLTVTHEFGHFCDDYINLGATYNMDVAECCSQGLEYLLLEYLDGPCSQKQAEQLVGGKLLDTLDLYVWQGLYSEFEDRAYSRDPQELTVEELGEIYHQVCVDFGMEDDAGSLLYTMGWIDVPHFFQQPFYIVSYLVSNDVAMQLWTMEQQSSGSGVHAYLDFLHRTGTNAELMEVADEVGLGSPFAPGRLEEVARAVSQALDLEYALDDVRDAA